MSEVFEHPRTVTPDEIDELGHVGNVRYLAWLLDAATAHSAAQGWPWSRYEALGAAWVVRRHELDYLRPALVGDAIVVRTWIPSLARASCVRGYDVVRPRDGERLLRARTTWALIDLAKGTPRRIPEAMRDAIAVDPGPDE